MLVNGVTDFTEEPLEIMGGTWMVGANYTMSSEQNVKLKGGAFATADGVTATVGRLMVDSEGGGIVVGANSAVQFLDSSAETWSGLVEVTCGAGSSVRFGTSSGALTSEQKARLRLNGKRATLSSDGFVTIGGFCLIYR